MAMNSCRWWLFAAFAAVCLPGLSQPVQFTVNFSDAGPVGVPHAIPLGTCAPYGSCQIGPFRQTSSQSTYGSFIMASGSLDFTVAMGSCAGAATAL